MRRAHLNINSGKRSFYKPDLLIRHGFAAPPLPFRLNGRGASFAGSLLPLPCGVTRHLKTVINRFEMAHPLGKAILPPP